MIYKTLISDLQNPYLGGLCAPLCALCVKSPSQKPTLSHPFNRPPTQQSANVGEDAPDHPSRPIITHP
jgi:hypothetical protein